MRSDKRYKAVFFDMGYTLVNFDPSAEALLRQALQQIGVETTQQELAQAQQAARHALTSEYASELETLASRQADLERELAGRRALLAELGVNDEEAVEALFAREDALFSAPGAVRLYPEVRFVLAELCQQGFRLGIISNWSWNLRRRCNQVGITGYFDQIIASAYVGHEKPHPAIFNQALKAMGVAPEQAIHIGDDYEADVHGAQGVGMEGVLVWRSTTPPPNTHHPVIADLTGLYDLLLAAI